MKTDAISPVPEVSPQSSPLDSKTPDASKTESTPFDVSPDVIAQIFGESPIPGTKAVVTLGDNNQVTAIPHEMEDMGMVEEKPAPEDGVSESMMGSPKNVSTKASEKDLPPVNMKDFNSY